VTKSDSQNNLSDAAATPNEATGGAAASAETSSALENARKSVEDAAAISGGLWLSYLFALFYIGIAAGGVTHKDLLLENAVKLPFLNVELPLVAFFSLAPILFIIVHAYTLLHFVLLAAKVGAYDQALRAELGDSRERRDAERRRLPSNIFVQFLAGPHEIRAGGLGWLLKAIAWISLVIGPVLLLLLIQAQFLAYHREDATWIQRFTVLGDVALLWVLWPAVLKGTSDVPWPPLFLHRRLISWMSLVVGPTLILSLLQAQFLLSSEWITWVILADLTLLWALWPATVKFARALKWPILSHPRLALLSLVPVLVAFFLATFPGGWLGDWNRNHRYIPGNPITGWLGAVDKDGKPVSTSLHHLLFAGEIDEVSRRRKSPFSNSLILTGFDALEAAKIDDEKKLNWSKQSVGLHGRNLQGAIFDLSDLRKADLTNANLQGASFFKAKLQQASLAKAQLQRASLVEAQLQDATLDHADLQGARLVAAQLQGARLVEAQLQRASLNLAQLQGASLLRARLQGATLFGAGLQGAALDQADLQGTELVFAQLQGASLAKAQLQGATLFRAGLEGAALVEAQLEGAALVEAQLEGAALDQARLQGASLDQADLQGASLFRAQLQGAWLVEAQLEGASLDQAQLQGAVAMNA
jgi:uncharacterized protein YjbI with pentapeptide repeats